MRHTVLLSIVTWNHQDSIQATIASILEQRFNDYHIVVFDNHSSDKTIEYVKQYAGPKLTIIEHKSNIGFCGGHNYVVQAFDYEYLILVNPDVVLKPDYIRNTIEVFARDPAIGAVCGLLVQSDEENPYIDSMGMKMERSRRFILVNHGQRLNEVSIQSGYVAGMDGALPTFKRAAVDSILVNGELFNNLFFAHKEDWDVSWRLLLFGWRSYFNSSSVAIHPRYFKPGNLAYRLKIPGKIKFDAFKNQLLLLMINDDKSNMLKDAHLVFPRLISATFFCILFEVKSLRAFPFILRHRKQIAEIRKVVQNGRRISPAEFRAFLT